MFWFYGDGRIVVCTHGIVKKGQKTPQRDVRRAEAELARYRAAERAGKLTIHEGEA